MCAFYEVGIQTPIESLQKAGHVIGVQWMLKQNLAAGSRFNDHGFIDYTNDKKVILNTFKRSRNIISGKDVRAIFEELLNDNLPSENQITVDDFLADNSSL